MTSPSKIKLHDQKDTKTQRRQLRKEMTKAELTLWKVLRGKQLGYKFRRQHGIGRYIVDFYCPELDLIIEIDGGIHGEKDRPENDADRNKYLEKLGFKIKRYKNDQVCEELESVYNDLKKRCDYLKSLKPPL